MKPAAISGDFANYRPVLGRQVLQIVIEVPIERQAEVFDVLGYPTGGGSIPVAVARLNAGSSNGRTSDFDSENAGSTTAPATKPEGHRWSELSPAQQTGIIRNEPEFWEFASAANADEARDYIRQVCEVESCADIKPGSQAAILWGNLQVRYGNFLRLKRGAA